MYWVPVVKNLFLATRTRKRGDLYTYMYRYVVHVVSTGILLGNTLDSAGAGMRDGTGVRELSTREDCRRLMSH